MHSYESSGGIRRAFVKAWKPLAWLSAVALATGGILVAQQAAAPQQAEAASIDFANNPHTTTTTTPSYKGSNLNLKNPWMPAGSTTDDALKLLFGSGVDYADGPSFVGSWTGDPNTKLITNQNLALATTYVSESDTSARSSRMSAMDAENGPTLYIWSNDSQDYWKTAPNHPKEFDYNTTGTDATSGAHCNPDNWNNDDRGSWVSVRAYNVGTTTGTVFWVPNPRAADVMSAYVAPGGRDPNYPGASSGMYTTPRDANWRCNGSDGDTGNWDDGWGGGEVIPNTGEIFFTSRQSSKISSTFRTMIFDPRTGVFASSGQLKASRLRDDIFEDPKAKVAGDLMVDGNHWGYIIAKGKAPANSVWADPNMPDAWAAYLLRIEPTPNPNYNPNDPYSLQYKHNGEWQYSIMQKLYPAPDDTGSGAGRDLNTAFAPQNGCDNGNNCTKMQGLKGSNWFNGQIYTTNNKYMYRINPTTGRVYNVPQNANGALVGAGADTNVDVRDMASGQGPISVSGVVFFDKNANGRQDAGEWGIPGMQVMLYSDDGSGVWVQLSDTGRHPTNSSGEYTFLLSGPGKYQVRVVQPSFNPDANDSAPSFETDVHNASATMAYQTAATSGSANDGYGTNKVTAHCKKQNPTPPYNVLDGDTLAGFADLLDPKPCSGAQDWPYNDPTPTPFNPANTSPNPYPKLDNSSGTLVAIYSTIDVTVEQASSSRVPNADFGLATTTNYKVAVESHNGMGAFTIDGQSLVTTQPDVQVTSNPIPDVLGGDRTSTITLPNKGWSVTKVEIRDPNDAVVATLTPKVDAADATKVTFDWSLPALPRGYTAKVYTSRGCDPDPDKSTLEITPTPNEKTPLPPGEGATSAYQLKVTVYDKNTGEICPAGGASPTFEIGPNLQPKWAGNVDQPGQPKLSSNTCTIGNDGSCFVTVTSTEAGEFEAHGKVAGQDVKGGGDPNKASPQSVYWQPDCSLTSTTDLTVKFAIEEPEVPAGQTAHGTMTVTDTWGNECPNDSGSYSLDPKGVSFTATPNGSYPVTLVDPPGMTMNGLNDGTISIPLTANPPVTTPYDVTATYTNAKAAKSDKDTVTFTVGACDPNMSGMTLTPTDPKDAPPPIPSGHSYTADVQLRNADGSICTIPTEVTFSTTLDVGTDKQANPTLSSVTCMTGTNGKCVTPPTVVSDTDGSAMVHAQIPAPTPADPANKAELVGDFSPTDNELPSPQKATWKPCGDAKASLFEVTPGPPPAYRLVGSGVDNQYTLKVTVRDENGNTCQGGATKAPTFTVGPNETPAWAPANPPADQPKLSQTTCTPDPTTGVCSVTVTSTVAGTFPLHGLLSGQDIGGETNGVKDPAKASPQSRMWQPDCRGDVDVKFSIAEDRVAKGGTAHGTMTVTDPYGNPCPTDGSPGSLDPKNVTIAADPSSPDPLTVQSPPGMTTSPTERGKIQVPLTASPPLETKYDVTANYQNPGADPTTPGKDDVIFFPPPCDAKASELSITPAGPLHVNEPDNRTYTATVTVKNALDELCPAGATTSDVTFDVPTAVGGQPSVGTVTCNQATATCSAPVSSTLTGIFPIHGRLDGTDVGDQAKDSSKASPQDREWRLDCSPTSNAVLTATFVIAEDQVPAGGTAHGTLSLKDEYNNECPGPGVPEAPDPKAVTITSVPTSPFPLSVVTPPGATLNPDGTISVPLTADPLVKTTYDVTATYTNAHGPASGKDTVTFVPCVPDPKTSELSITPAGPLDVNGADPTYTATVTVKNAAGALCPAGATTKDVTFSVEGAVGGQPSVGATTCDEATATCSAPITSTKIGTFPIHGKVPDPNTGTPTDVGTPGTATASPQSRTWFVNCSPESKTPLKATFVIAEDEVPAGQTAHGTLTVTDLHDNKCPNDQGPNSLDPKAVTITSNPSSPYPVTVVSPPGMTMNGKNDGTIDIPLTATPEFTTPYDVTATYTNGAGPVPATDKVTFTVIPEKGCIDAKLSSYSAVSSSGHLPVWADGGTYDLTATVIQCDNKTTAENEAGKPLAGATVEFSATLPGAGPTGEVTMTPTTCTTDVNGKCIAVVKASATNKLAGQYDVVAKANGVTIDPTTDLTKNAWQKPVDGYDFPAAPTIEFWGCKTIDPGKSTFTAVPSEQFVGAPVDLTITAVDPYGNECKALKPGDFAIVGHATDPTTNPDIYPTAGTFRQANGNQYLWQITSEPAGVFQLVAEVTNGDGTKTTLTQKPSVKFIPRDCDVNNSKITVIKQIANADNKDQTHVHVLCIDRYGNISPGRQIVATNIKMSPPNPQLPDPNTATTNDKGEADLYWTSPKAGTFGVEILLSGVSDVKGWQPLLTYEPLVGSATLDVTPKAPEAPIAVDNAYTATVSVWDLAHDPMRSATVQFTISADPNTITTATDHDGKPYLPTLSATTCKTGDGLNGTTLGQCGITVTSTLADVNFYLHALVNKTPPDAANSPATLLWTAGPVCTAGDTCLTNVTVTQDNQMANNSAMDEATLETYDIHKNVVKGAAWTSAKVTASDPMTVVTPSGTTDSTGKAIIQYKASQIGAFKADVLVPGAVPTSTVPGSPVTLHFNNPVKTADLLVSPTGPQKAGEQFTLDAKLLDQGDKPVVGNNVTFQADPGVEFVGGVNTCVTGADGQCVTPVKVTATKPGKYEVSLPADMAETVLHSPQTIEFTQGPLCKATVVVDPNGVKADGVAQDIAKVTAWDCEGNLLSGVTVTSQAPTPVKTSTIDTTGPDGTTQINYTSTQAGTFPTPIKATLDGKTVDVVVPSWKTGDPTAVDIQFSPIDCTTPGEWSVRPTDPTQKPPLTVGETEANSYTATATVLNKLGQKCEGGVVTFGMTPDQQMVPGPGGHNGLEWTSKSCPTDANGTCSVTIYSTAQGSFVMTPKVGASGFTPPSAELTWTAGAACEAPELYVDNDHRCHLAVENNNATLDKPITVIGYFFDRYGNPKQNYQPGWESDDGVVLGVTRGATDNVPTTDKDGMTKVQVWASSEDVLANRDVKHPFHELYSGNDVTFTAQPGSAPDITKYLSSPVDLFWKALQLPKGSQPIITKVDGNDVTDGKKPSIKNTQPLIEGTIVSTPLNPAKVGDIITVNEGSKEICNTKVEGTVGNLTWSCSPTAPLAEGEHTITAVHKAPDLQDSTESFPASFIIDTTKPVITVSNPKPDQHVNNKSPWPVAGTASDYDPATKAQTPLKSAPVTVKDKVSGEVLCTATTNDLGEWSCNVPAGKPGPDGPYTLSATVVDAAGNVSDPAEVPYVIDNKGPDIIITSPTQNQHLNNDPITVTGTTDTPGVVHVDDGHGHPCDAQVSTQMNADNRYTWSCDLSGVPEGPQTITAKQTDQAGNPGEAKVDIFVDRKTPPDPVIVTPPKDAHINDNTPTVSGTIADDSPDHPLDPGTVVIVQDKNDPTNECVATVQRSADGKTGTWSCDLPKALPDGPNTVTAQAKDPAGNVSNKVERPFVVDTKTPPDPVIEHPANGSYVNASMMNDNKQLNVSGTIADNAPDHPLDPGTVVIVTDKNDPTNQCVATVLIAPDGKTGTWNCDLRKRLPEGPGTVTAQAKDLAGNLSNKVESSFIVDTIPPPISNPDTTDPKNIGVDTEPGATIEIKNDDGKTICTTTADDKGHAVCTVKDPNDVPKKGDTIHITATDKAGNKSTYDTNIVWVTVSKPVLYRPDDLQQIITGHAFQPGEKVHATIDGVIDLGWATAGDNGEVQFIYNAPDQKSFEGKHQVVLRGDHSGPAKADFAVDHRIITGANVSGPLAGAAVLATALGAGLILIGWRRRRENEEAIPQQA